MKFLKRVDTVAVLAALNADDPNDEFNGNSIAKLLINKADEKFAGEWQMVSLSSFEVLNIFLPHHEHKGSMKLIPPEGMRVKDVISHWSEINEQYKNTNSSCHEKIVNLQQKPLSTIYLSAKPLDVFEDYQKMSNTEGSLVHLDGLHRLVAWAIAGRFNDPGLEDALTAFVAGSVDSFLIENATVKK